MAESSLINGTPAEPTPAQKLMERHITDRAPHKVELEEVVDEEDIQHPPPSAALSSGSKMPLSGKSAGKQPAMSDQSDMAASDTHSDMATIDTLSETSFPALGTPGQRSANAVPTTWSARPPHVVTAGVGNGSNGQMASGTSTPASEHISGLVTPVSATRAPAKAPAALSLPGRHNERVQFAPSQLTPRNQLKKPVQDVLRDINKRSKARIDMSTGPGGVVIFEGTGPVESVRQSLKEVAKELGSKQSVKVPVPVSVKGNIIGRQGATIQNISKRTGARIQMPPPEKQEQEYDDDATIDVLIEGDAISAEMARREIEAIVNEHTSSVNLRIKNIPAEYYPFLAGPHNAHAGTLQNGRDIQVKIPQYHTWAKEAPAPAPANRQPVNFTTAARHPIQISGDRAAATEARALLEQKVEQLRRQLTVDQMAIERGRHQFIIGDKGASLHDLLAETGCAAIFPPDEHESETITIVGPPERLEEGMNKILDLAASMYMSNVDIARQHSDAPMGAQTHARNINKYLHHRQAMADLESMHDARIMAQIAASSPTAWEVFTRDAKTAMRARSDIMNIISAHPPTRFDSVAVDPFFHEHIRRKATKHVREKHGVHVVVPDVADDEPQVLLVYEGPTALSDYQIPRKQPSGPEVQQFGPALKDAQRYIEALIGPQDSIVVKHLPAPAKFHDKIQRHIHKRQQALPSDQIPVQVRFGGPSTHSDAKTPQVTMRGPKQDVETLMQELSSFIAQEERDELERDFTLSFDFPQKYANQLVGRSGTNIKKLREEFDVAIRLNDGKVEIQGPEAKASACKSHIIALARRLDDEATHVIKIKPQYHKDMIGAKGAQVHRLQDSYKVKINFPRMANSHDTDEADGNDQRRFKQGPDEVVIRGPKRGADEARDELLDLLQYTMDTSHTASVSVSQNLLPRLIGSGGRELEALRANTGAHIDVANKDEVDDSGRSQVKIRGSKKQVEEAKKAIEQAARDYDSTVSRSIEVDRKHHRTIIGPGGSTLRDIAVKAGGPDDRQILARMVRFPKTDAEGNTIRLEGGEDFLRRMIEQINALVLEKEDQMTSTVDVAPANHRLLIGRGGESKRNLEAEFRVSLDVPRQTSSGAERSHVKVTGRSTNVEKAIAHIQSMFKDREEQAVSVPMKYHHMLADNGQFFRRLRNDHKVSVNHAGVTPAPRQQAHKPRRAGELPLITNEGDSVRDKFSWETHALHANGPEGDIPWVLSGPSAEEVSKARSKLDAALGEAQEHDTLGYLIVPDPRSYGRVIGPGGAGINKIRKETRTKINVPKTKDQGEAIEIVGSLAGCEKAKAMIIAAIEANDQARAGSSRYD